ncbi:MAG: hypothetical protein VW239_02765, partial [Candidatus Nanopelagicales bacterium]
HIEPQHLREVMRALIDKSFRWVAAVEYEAPYETAIEYRGHSDKCWKRPYDVLYKDLGLQMLTSWWKPVGFDDCTAWLMQR